MIVQLAVIINISITECDVDRNYGGHPSAGQGGVASKVVRQDRTTTSLRRYKHC